MPQIEVTFNIDVNGILNVSAKDLGTGKESKVTIQNSGGLSKDEIEKMKRDAETHAAEDKKRRETIEMKNQAESLAFSTEKSLKDYGEKVTADTSRPDRKRAERASDAIKSDDGDRIKKSMENLSHGFPEACRGDVQGRRQLQSPAAPAHRLRRVTAPRPAPAPRQAAARKTTTSSTPSTKSKSDRAEQARVHSNASTAARFVHPGLRFSRSTKVLREAQGFQFSCHG